ncbi:MAG TPA: hypothetical protein VEC57_20860 [Candidatus Limnocylindrales bacterium]|nr:hypothetical protein [Candidatus Limnocylindrales bacterium]
MKIIQEDTAYLSPRGTIEFDEYERNEYVARFLDAFKAGLTEEELCAKCYAIHLELRDKHDLYFAVFDKLETRQRSAIRWYAICRGEYRQPPKLKVEP